MRQKVAELHSGAKHRRRSLALMLVVAVVAALSLLSIGASAGIVRVRATAAKAPYVIGMNADMTGVDASEGQGLQAGALAYINALNKRGGINGHPVKMDSLSDNDTGATTEANVLRLITSDHVSALIGFQSSVPAQAAAPTANKYRVPMLASTVSAGLVSPTQPYLYALTIETAQNAAPDVQFAAKLMTTSSHHTPVNYASITTAGFPALAQWQGGIQAGAAVLGWTAADNEAAPFPALDASGNVSRIIAANPDILINGLGEDAWLVSEMKQLAAAGKTFPVIEYDSSDWATIRSIGASNLYYVTALAFATKKGTPKLWADAAAAKVDPNGPYIERGYLQALVITDALQTCGYPCSGKQLAKQLDKANDNTYGITTGHVRYTPDNHQAVSYEKAYRWSPASAAAPTLMSSALHTGTG